jgi:hypothetical protein
MTNKPVDKKKMACNKPRRTPCVSKKFVVKAHQDGSEATGETISHQGVTNWLTEKIVRFGAPNMRVNKPNPKRRKSFRDRRGRDKAGANNKLTTKHWSCKNW